MGQRRGRNGGAAAGIAGRLIERAIDNPAASGGLLVMGLTATAIVVNATMLQPHDAPRPHIAGTAAAPPAVPLPRPREPAAEAPKPAAAMTSAPVQAAPAKPAVASGPPKPAAEAAPTLIADVQRELTRLGFYLGTVDGIAGARTKAAISAYQASVHAPVSGVASADLLAAMRQAPVPKPAAAAPARTPVPPTAIPTSTTVAAAPSPIAAVIARNDGADSDTYRKVQLALNQIGYGAIPVDGRAGRETADAIRRFELDYGLPVTGEPGDAVLKRLIAIGALAAR